MKTTELNIINDDDDPLVKISKIACNEKGVIYDPELEKQKMNEWFTDVVKKLEKQFGQKIKKR